jgi:hypothetical protein
MIEEWNHGMVEKWNDVFGSPYSKIPLFQFSSLIRRSAVATDWGGSYGRTHT